MSLDHLLASRIPEEGCRIVQADGPEGEVCVDLDPVRHGDGQFDRHLETNSWSLAGVRVALVQYGGQPWVGDGNSVNAGLTNMRWDYRGDDLTAAIGCPFGLSHAIQGKPLVKLNKAAAKVRY